MTKKILMTKKQIDNLKKNITIFFTILSIITTIDVNYNVNCYEWIHICLVLLFPPYSFLYFILRFFNLLNKPKK